MLIEQTKIRAIFRMGGVVSIIQSFLFFVIALCALGLGVDNFLTKGFGYLYAQGPALFILLCLAFVLIAVLGIAITPAERMLLPASAAGISEFGGNLALLGHMGTIAFFSWWIIFSLNNPSFDQVTVANSVIGLKWGVMFELLFVGGWVWLIAWAIFRHDCLSKSFGWLSIGKAASFWFAFIGFLLNDKVMLVSGIVLVAVVLGPAWHFLIAVKFLLPRSRHEDR